MNKSIEDVIDQLEAEVQHEQRQLAALSKQEGEEFEKKAQECRDAIDTKLSEIYKIACDRLRLVAQSFSFLRQVAEYVQNTELKSMCFKVLDDPKFGDCTAAVKRHQAYKGGLVVHTAEVLDIALDMAKSPSLEVDKDVLITATILHDYGKIYDYRPPLATEKTRFGYTEHCELIRHLPRSYAVFMAWSDGKVDEEIRMKISHCILAHHGRQEWGSPVEPKTTEAAIIHFADMLSANHTKDIYTR